MEKYLGHWYLLFIANQTEGQCSYLLTPLQATLSQFMNFSKESLNQGFLGSSDHGGHSGPMATQGLTTSPQQGKFSSSYLQTHLLCLQPENINQCTTQF